MAETEGIVEMIATTRLIDKRKKNEAQILEQKLALEQQQKDLIRQKLNLEEHTVMLEKYNMQIANYSKELEQQKKELEQANVTKDRFFSIIAHDLRNAMNSLTNIASIFEDYYETMTPEQITKNIESFIKSTSNTGKLLENLLNWARANTGGMAFNPSQHRIKSIVDIAFSDVGAQAQNKNIELVFESNTESEIVHCDADMIDTILRNLISNAIKFSAPNKKISVIINKYLEDDKYVTFAVKDQGVGIGPETIEKLFRIDTKVSTKGTSGEPGTGLGLILCKEFIDKHNCKI
jgi:signal transduction histidine kinase